MRRRAAFSEVISAVILSGVVLAVGGFIWSYSLGATTVIAEDYAEGTFSLVDEITERFIVEHVSNNSDGSALLVWVYNYGDVDTVVDTYITINGTIVAQSFERSVSAGAYSLIEISVSPALANNEEISIKVHSRRQNSAYYTYYS